VIYTSVTSLLQKEDRYGPLTERQRTSLERVLRNSQKAQRLIHEMLEIASSEDGIFRGEHFYVEATLRESILDVLDTATPSVAQSLRLAKDAAQFQRILEEHGLFVEVNERHRRTPFFHDSRKVQQIMRNLLSNALKYRRRRVDVSIEGERDLILSVADDGSGIAQEDQKSIFYRFARLTNEKLGDQPGLGLGLWGVKALVGRWAEKSSC